jgi:hypothetical protein
MKTLISILAGILTHSVLFTYLGERTTCGGTITGKGTPKGQRMRIPARAFLRPSCSGPSLFTSSPTRSHR